MANFIKKGTAQALRDSRKQFATSDREQIQQQTPPLNSSVRERQVKHEYAHINNPAVNNRRGRSSSSQTLHRIDPCTQPRHHTHPPDSVVEDVNTAILDIPLTHHGREASDAHQPSEAWPNILPTTSFPPPVQKRHLSKNVAVDDSVNYPTDQSDERPPPSSIQRPFPRKRTNCSKPELNSPNESARLANSAPAPGDAPEMSPSSMTALSANLGEDPISSTSTIGWSKLCSGIGKNLSGLFTPIKLCFKAIGSCITTLGTCIIASADAFKNLATSSYLGPIVSILSVFGVILAVLATVLVVKQGVKEAYAEAKVLVHGSWSWAEKAAEAAYSGGIVAKDFLVDVGAQSVGVAGGAALTTKALLCQTSYGAYAVQQLGYSCQIPNADTNVLAVIDRTAVEVGTWVNVSTELLPHADYLKSMSIAVDRQRLLVRLTNVNFGVKENLDETMIKYSEGLLSGGTKLFETTIDTEHIMFLMLTYLFETEDQLSAVAKQSGLWRMYQTRQVVTMLGQLVEHLNALLVDLLKFIDHLQSDLGDLRADGERYALLMQQAQKDVQTQITEKGYLFNWLQAQSELFQMRQKLTQTMTYTPIMSIIDRLRNASVALSPHRKYLSNTVGDLSELHHHCRTHGPKLILAQLEATSLQLASFSAHSEIQRAKTRRRREKERAEKNYNYPDGTHV